jgi:prolyl-tRNA synthetase
MADDKKETFNIDKENKFAEWYDRILVEAEIMDKRYPVKGMPIFTKYGYHMHCAIMEILEQEWTKQNIDKVQFPVLIPESYLVKEQKHLEGFSAEVFWATEGGDKKLEVKCALRPTSETAMYSMFSLWVRSFRDLPLKVHQTCSVYRYETKVRLFPHSTCPHLPSWAPSCKVESY